jgi:uroporphyrin-III C-methyltransferase / precorrin-2 dehydrogenase / sirohydrochlorin ferrochelatase
MKQLPIFVNLADMKVILLGEGPAADAKRRLIERAGGSCTSDESSEAKLAFVAIEEEAEAIAAAARLRLMGLLVNVVDRPEYCDFTTPAIVDRDPVLIAVGTGGASAGLAKAIRQRIEAMLPQSLGQLAQKLFEMREDIRERWPDGNDRRRAIDAALARGGALDPSLEQPAEQLSNWLGAAEVEHISGLHFVELTSNDPEDLTLRTARLLGEADHVYHDIGVAEAILTRARADAERHAGDAPDPPPTGLILQLRLQARA